MLFSSCSKEDQSWNVHFYGTYFGPKFNANGNGYSTGNSQVNETVQYTGSKQSCTDYANSVLREKYASGTVSYEQSSMGTTVLEYRYDVKYEIKRDY